MAAVLIIMLRYVEEVSNSFLFLSLVHVPVRWIPTRMRASQLPYLYLFMLSICSRGIQFAIRMADHDPDGHQDTVWAFLGMDCLSLVTLFESCVLICIIWNSVASGFKVFLY
jgi:hypothetical protein